MFQTHMHVNKDNEYSYLHACTNATVQSHIRTDTHKLPLSLVHCSGLLVLGHMLE